MHAGIPTHPPPGPGTPSLGADPPGADPLGADPPPKPGTRPDQVPPWSRHPSRSKPPCAVHAGRYRQQAGGTYPTGMQSSFNCHQPLLLGTRSMP